MRLSTRIAILAVSALACIVAAPAIASATVWVSPQPVTTGFNSCAKPGYNSIQKAIDVNAPNTTIHVCTGTYAEQLHIEKAVTIAPGTGETPTVTLPASPSDSTTPCDAAEQQDLITVCAKGNKEVVRISGLTLEGRWTGAANCGKNYYDVFVGGTANLLLTNSSILHAGAEPLNGCQQGIGIRVGRNATSQVGTATLSGVNVSGYQKGGIVVDGVGSKATIMKGAVTGVGPNGFENQETHLPEPTNIAQNGIQVSRGAEGKMIEEKITANECAAPSCGANTLAQEEEDAAGVLFYKESKGSVTKSTINKNDIGVYHLGECCVTTPQASITSNTLEEDRFWGVVLDQGVAAVSKNKIIGNNAANVGIQLIQYVGQENGAQGKGSEDEITGMTKCGVEGFSDNNPSDQVGSLTLTATKAKFSGNTTNVCNNNTTGKLIIKVT